MRSASSQLEGLEARTYFAVTTNGQGWTVVTPGTDTKTVYVSTSGHDTNNNGLSPASPVASVARARQIARSGFPDQILLRRGDTFVGTTITNWDLSGRSEQEPFVLGAYTDPNAPSTARPKIASGVQNGFHAAGTANSHVFIMGIAFEAHTRNYREPPANGTFTTSFRTESQGATNGMRVLGPFTNLLVEDCSFQYYKSNLSIQTTTSNGVTRQVSDVRLRRNVIADAYAPNVDTNGVVFQEPAIGVYAEGVRRLTMDGNLLSHNGWAEDHALGAVGNIWSHNAYINTLNDDFVFVNNISADAAATGIQARAGGVVRDNLFLRNPIAMTYGYMNGDGKLKAGGVSGEVSGNVVIGTSRILDSTRGYGLELGHLKPISQGGGTVVRNNVFANDAQDNNQFAIKLEIGRIDNPDSPPDVGINDLRIEGNVVYSWARGLYVNAGYNNSSNSNNRVLRGLTVTGNDFQRLFSSAGSMIEHLNPFVASAESWSNNRYNGSANDSGSSRWFKVLNTQNTFAQWKATYEPTAQQALGQFPDAGRSASSYNATIGGTASVDAFLDEAMQQSRAFWRPAYAATAVNAYVRAGYAGARVDVAAPTASADAANVTIAGDSVHTFTVTYSDDNQLNAATLGFGDVRVDGPGGYSAVASLVSSTANAEGDRRIATYTVPAPGGSWSSSANGVYQVLVQGGEVFDVTGKPATAGAIGAFAVTLDPAVPAAVVTSAPPVTIDASPATVTVTYTGGTTPGLATVVTPLNPGFETPNVAASDPLAAFAVTPAGADWSFAGAAGISANGSILTLGNPPAPQGAQVAFLQADGSFSQLVDGWQAGTYTLSFQAARRALSAGVHDFQVYVNGQLVGTFAPQDTAYQTFATAPFAVGGGAFTVQFVGLNTGGSLDAASFIDDVRIAGTTNPVQQTIAGLSLDAADVRLAGASGFSLAATSGTPQPDANNAVQKSVAYTFPAPAGGWAAVGATSLDVNVTNGQVLTTSFVSVPAVKVGSLALAVDLPNAIVTANDATPGSVNPHTFTVKYTDSVPGAALFASLDNNDLRVLGPAGFNKPAGLVSRTGVGTAASPLVAVYSVDPPTGGWVSTANGTYAIVAQPSQVTDSDGNALPPATIGQFDVAVDVAAPLVVATVTGSVTAPSTSGKTFTLDYYDASGINAATFDDADVRVTGPAGFNQPAVRGTVTPRGNGAKVLYTLAAPSPSGWKSRHNGTYTVTLQAGQVNDTVGNAAAAAATLGTFSVSLETTAPTATFTAVSPNPRATAVPSVLVRFSEAVSGVDATDFALTRNGTAVPLTGATVATSDNVTFTVSGLSAVTNLVGTYVLSVKAGGLEDAAGNLLAAGASTTWQFTTTPPPAVTSVVINDNAAQRSKITSISVVFDRAVALDPGAFELVRRVTGGPGVVIGVTPVTGDGVNFILTFTAPDIVGGSLADGVYDLRIVASRVHTGSTTGPAMLADYTLKFHRLFSDADGDGDSDNSDSFQMRGAYNKTAADAGYKWYFDYDADGDVDNADNFQVRSRRVVEFKGY